MTNQNESSRAGFRIVVDDVEYTILDPVPTGRQILVAAGKSPIEEHLLYQLLPGNLLEDISLEETTDVRGDGKERFISFLSDRSFRFELDGQRQDWGMSRITETTLRKLAGADNKSKFRVWLERRGQEDLKLEVGQWVDLSEAGIERFYTGRDDTNAGCNSTVLPSADRRYVSEHELVTEDVAQGEQKGIVFKNYPLPLGRFQVETADILVVLPRGYPDTAPDMFFADPWLTLKATGAYPEKADQAFSFAGRNWQRWSRHNEEWRAGRDCIQTMLRRIDSALRGES